MVTLPPTPPPHEKVASRNLQIQLSKIDTLRDLPIGSAVEAHQLTNSSEVMLQTLNLKS